MSIYKSGLCITNKALPSFDNYCLASEGTLILIKKKSNALQIVLFIILHYILYSYIYMYGIKGC